MKKFFVLVAILLLCKFGYAQYPLNQFLGSDSTLVTSKGGLKGRLVNTPFTDTTDANTQRIKDYPGAMIYTTSPTAKLWLRNNTATGWNELGSSGSSVNIYNTDGTLTGDRQLNAVGYDLRFNDVKEFGVGSDSVSITVNSPRFKLFGLGSGVGTRALRIDGSGYVTTSDTTISTDTAVYDPNPSHWYTTESVNNPTFARYMATENTTYVPSGVQRASDGAWFVFVKGDLYNRLYTFKSINKGKTWSYIGVAVQPSNAQQDSTYNLEPYATIQGDSCYLYYMGGGPYPSPNFGIWLATCHVDSLDNVLPFAKMSSPIISNASFQSLMGIAYETGYIGLSSIVKKDGTWYFHGGWLNGNVSVNPVLRTRLWVGTGTDLRNVTSIDSIPIPIDSIQVGVKAPSVWKETDYYKMIYSAGDPYYNGGYLMSAYSSDLVNWTKYADSFAFPPADTSWEGKQKYSGQLMKIQSGNYDQPLLVYEDSVYAGPQPYTYGYYTYLFSASYDSIYFVDQSGIMRIYPQKSTPLFALDDYGNYPFSVQRNTTTVLNIPKSGTYKNGYLDSLDFRTFTAKADSSGQWSYIQNRTTAQTDANFNVGGYGYVKKMNVGGSFPDASAFALTADGYQVSGNSFQVKNASNFGIRKNTQVTSEVNEYWYGTGHGYLENYTSGNSANWKAYKYNFRSIFSPTISALTIYGKADNDTTVEINSTRSTGASAAHTSDGISLSANHNDEYNTTSSVLNSYAVEGRNFATRSSGANDLTNYGGRFSASGGQVNYSLSLGNPAQYEANYGSLFTVRSLTDKNYVDSAIAASGGSGVTTIAAINGTTKSANGAVISGANLYMQTVDATYPGLMTSADKQRLDSNAYIHNVIISGYDTLTRVVVDTLKVKALRVIAGSFATVTPTITDTTISYSVSGVDTTGAFLTSVYRKTASDSVFYVKGGTHTFAFRDSLSTGSVSPGGNFNNIQINRNLLFTSPGSDSLTFSAGLQSKGLLVNDANGVFGGTAVQNAAGWNRVLTVRNASHAMLGAYASTPGIDLTMVASSVGGYSGAAGGLFGTVSNHPLTFFTNASGRIFILSTGNVGVGTSTADSMLTVLNGLYTQRGVRFSGLPTAKKLKQVYWDATGTLSVGDTTKYLTESTYTPTLTNTTNVAASTAYTTYYVREGDWVHVWGTVDIDATAASTISEIGMSLPIASGIAQVYELAGTAAFEDNTSVQIKGDTTNARAMWRFTPQSATNNTYSFHFSYKYTAP